MRKLGQSCQNSKAKATQWTLVFDAMDASSKKMIWKIAFALVLLLSISASAKTQQLDGDQDPSKINRIMAALLDYSMDELDRWTMARHRVVQDAVDEKGYEGEGMESWTRVLQGLDEITSAYNESSKLNYTTDILAILEEEGFKLDNLDQWGQSACNRRSLRMADESTTTTVISAGKDAVTPLLILARTDEQCEEHCKRSGIGVLTGSPCYTKEEHSDDPRVEVVYGCEHCIVGGPDVNFACRSRERLPHPATSTTTEQTTQSGGTATHLSCIMTTIIFVTTAISTKGTNMPPLNNAL